MRFLLLFFGLIITVHVSVAQTVSSLVSSPTIGTQETVSYTLEISGAEDADIGTPSPPDAEGLVLVSTSASRGSSIYITNGTVSRTVSYTWHYRPEQEGDARILEATVTIGGEVYTASEISITVVPQAQRPRPQRRSPFGGFSLFDDPVPAAPPPEVTEQDIFIRTQQSDREVYLNEPVTLEYLLYFRPGTLPRNSRQSDSWDAEGFWREELNNPDNQSPEIVIENGIRYQVVSIRRVVVFPTRSGELSIDPLRIMAEVQSPNANLDPFSSSLFSRTYSTVERASPPVSILSKALPSGAPDGFTGSVGQYSLRAELSDTEVEVGDALQLTVAVEGVGNIALIEPPQPELPGIFEVYDPEVRTTKKERDGLIQGGKIYSWLLIPRSNGTFQIPPIEFVFFDPFQQEYITEIVDLDPIRITGTAPSTTIITSSADGFPVDDIELLKRDPRWTTVNPGKMTTSPKMQRLLKRDPRWTTVNPTPLHQHLWFYLILLVPLLGLTATAVLRRRVTRLATDTAWARNRRAHPLARKHLKKAKKLLEEETPDHFYAALEHAVLGFLGNRLNISERGLTRAKLATLLAEAGVIADSQQELIHFLDACDTVRYAPIPAEYSQMEEHLRKANEILSMIANELETIHR